MKNIIITTVFLLTLISCKAQIQVVGIYNDDKSPLNAYFKDVNNDFNPYIGEWKWTNGSSSLTIKFQKIVKHTENSNYPLYADYLIGEYKYIENGITKVNSLPLNYNNDDPYNYSIAGGIITTTNRGFPPCTECAPNTRFIKLSFGSPDFPQLQGKITMARFIENGIEKIRARIVNTDIVPLVVGYTGPEELKVPEGIYTFVKQ